MSSILIENGRVIDPSQGVDRVMNVFLEDGRIAALGPTPANGPAPEGFSSNDTRSQPSGVVSNAEGSVHIDASGKIVAPGLVDLNVQLREPGFEEDETIETGAAAALAGGFTSIACIPDTDPPIDTQAQVEFIRQKASRANKCHVFVLACVSKNQQGRELCEIGSLVEAGAVGFTDAPRPLFNAELLRRALEYCSMFDKPIFNHPEVLELSHDGVMHEATVSMVLGLKGMPADAEDVMTGRDLRLAESAQKDLGGRLHLINISTAGSVDLIRRAKSRGVSVTVGVNAANFALTDESLRTFNSHYKVNPPLRSREHVDACIAGLADGVLDVICSGHTPRAAEKKMQDLDQSPFGMVSLETTLSLVITHLIEPGHLDWMQALAKLTYNPATVLGLNKGRLQVGADADVTIIDPAMRWTVNSQSFQSKSSNTPFLGQQLTGRAIYTIVGGKVKHELGAG